MTCKDCFLYGHCRYDVHICKNEKGEYIQFPESNDVGKVCEGFKDKSRIVELPCKPGDKVYLIGFYPWESECGKCEHFMQGGFGYPCECLKTEDGRKAPECRTIQEYEFDLCDILNTVGWGDFGKTVFLSREEAEEALRKERKK